MREGIAEIEGFADSHLREFSTRRAEILKVAGPDASARSMEVAALSTRQSKERGVSREELHERWRSRGEEIGLDAETLSRAFDPEALFKGEPIKAHAVSHEQIGEAVTAHASHFERREAIRAVAESQRAGAPAAEVQRMADEFLASDQVLRVSETPRAERFTTQRIWELERQALATAERMQGEARGQAGELIAARVTQARPTLKADQCEMVHRLLADPEGIAVVVGEAGTGKSFAIVAAAEGWAQAGYELRAVAPTWRAANVLRSEGLEATSVARLLAQMQGAGDGSSMLNERTVLLVDEAGMVGSAELAALIQAADAAQAKLVLVSDHQQLGEIEAGGLYRALAERGDPIALDEVIRHNHNVDREAARMIREGEGRAALELYRSSERVTVAPDAEARREAMVADWHHAYSEGQDALMIAKRNTEVGRLNAIARELMRRPTSTPRRRSRQSARSTRRCRPSATRSAMSRKPRSAIEPRRRRMTRRCVRSFVGCRARSLLPAARRCGRRPPARPAPMLAAPNNGRQLSWHRSATRTPSSNAKRPMAIDTLTWRDRRREREIARQVLIERAEPAILPARLAPPSYIIKELGERPGDPEKAKTWDRGVRTIEIYRHEHGVNDTGSALGRKPESGADRLSHYRARNAIREVQCRLGRQQQLDRSAQRSRDASRDTGMDIGL